MTPLETGRWHSPRLPLVLMLVIALPASAVIAGLATLAISLRQADHQLPATYHWEGPDFERDVRAEAVAAHENISLALTRDAASGTCRLALAGAQPAAVVLQFTHPTDSRFDRELRFSRVDGRAGSGAYESACTLLPAAHWWLAARDDTSRWLLRGRWRGAPDDGLSLGARVPP